MIVSGEAILEILKMLESLESLIPSEKKSEYSAKKKEWEALKKACWSDYQAKEKSRDRGMEI